MYIYRTSCAEVYDVFMIAYILRPSCVCEIEHSVCYMYIISYIHVYIDR